MHPSGTVTLASCERLFFSHARKLIKTNLLKKNGKWYRLGDLTVLFFTRLSWLPDRKKWHSQNNLIRELSSIKTYDTESSLRLQTITVLHVWRLTYLTAVISSAFKPFTKDFLTIMQCHMSIFATEEWNSRRWLSLPLEFRSEIQTATDIWMFFQGVAIIARIWKPKMAIEKWENCIWTTSAWDLKPLKTAW